MSNIDNFLEYRYFSDTLRILLLICILIANLEVPDLESNPDSKNQIIKILYIIYELETLNTTDNLNFYSNLKTDISDLVFRNSDLPIETDHNYSYDYNAGGDRDNGEVLQHIKDYITKFLTHDNGDEMDADNDIVTPYAKYNFTIVSKF